MSIIYSYPEQGALNADDLLIGTSATKVGGKQKNITRNFSIQQIADFINRGVGFVDPVATDFQIPVFNPGRYKVNWIYNVSRYFSKWNRYNDNR